MLTCHRFEDEGGILDLLLHFELDEDFSAALGRTSPNRRESPSETQCELAAAAYGVHLRALHLNAQADSFRSNTYLGLEAISTVGGFISNFHTAAHLVTATSRMTYPLLAFAQYWSLLLQEETGFRGCTKTRKTLSRHLGRLFFR